MNENPVAILASQSQSQKLEARTNQNQTHPSCPVQMSKDGGGAKFGGEGEIEREEKTAAGVDKGQDIVWTSL